MTNSQIRNATPPMLSSMTTNLIYVVALPLFFIVMMIAARPFGLLTEWQFAKAGFAFNACISSLIIFVSTLIMRSIFCIADLAGKVDMHVYRAWCLFEIIVSSAFVALYICLIDGKDEGYFDVLLRCLYIVGLVSVFPYIIIDQALRLYLAGRRDADMREGRRMRFYDDRHNLKLAVDPSSVLYIEAEENYINIHYCDRDRVKRYQIRSSMKQIEALCAENGILRAHRSYYINPAHVKTLRKERESSIFAELDTDGRVIPVTKRYYEEIADRI